MFLAIQRNKTGPAALLFLTVASLVFSSQAQSPPPSPTPTPAAKEYQQAIPQKSQENSPANQPAFVPAPDNHSKAGKADQTANDPPRDWIPLLTFFIFIATGVQAYTAWRQAGYMAKGLRLTQQAADAARDSAKAATDAVAMSRVTERAIVIIESIGGYLPLSKQSVVVFTLKNFGKTVARDVKYVGLFISAQKVGFDNQFPITIAPQGTAEAISRSLLYMGLSPEQIENVSEGRQQLFFEFSITYADAFAPSYKYTANGKYEAALSQFIITSSMTD